MHNSSLTFLASTAMKFVELSPEEDIYQFIGEQLKELTGNSIVVTSSFDETSSSFCVQSVVGIGRYMDAVLKIMGRHPVGITSSINGIF